MLLFGGRGQGRKLDRDQHITQDAAEHYAVYIMADYAEKNGWASKSSSGSLWASFLDYLAARDWSVEADFGNKYPAYKRNVDKQIPNFVKRLHSTFQTSKFDFQIDEASFRNLGMKADFTIDVSGRDEPFMVSLKNYIGVGGITRPQVSSGTFLSFAAGFVFERVGVGSYADPRRPDGRFSGSSREQRNQVLKFEGREQLIAPLEVLENLQGTVRERLLTLKMYDKSRIREVVEHIVPLGQEAMIAIFDQLGLEKVREKFLERVGLDGTEEILYFDESNSIDSITNSRFHALTAAVNDESTQFEVLPVGQSLRFQFTKDSNHVLKVDVPLTVNTNGAWHRPKEKYEGTQPKNDKGHQLELAWGEIRPYKSREIATSTNTYVNLQATGIFD